MAESRIPGISQPYNAAGQLYPRARSRMSVHLSQEANEQLEQLLKLYPAASHPGTAVGVVNKLGEVLFLDATGVRDVETKTPMLKDTVSIP